MKGTHEHARFTLHRTLLKEIFTTNPFEFFGSTHDVTWKEVKEYLGENVKLNVFKGSKFIQADFEDDKKSVVPFTTRRAIGMPKYLQTQSTILMIKLSMLI